ncbi:hypothetical protein INT45_003145 [Circinella minor]|uniref:HAT C-terminal dimerisation domain-containing protein n=1 Tax=Circinella minor TaxID=1195481 RepID=A0A8H7RC72_9FUNG|nr:hypothetical protein INT45_003145 [Circinella minor]
MDPRLKYEWWEAENWDEYRSEAIELVNTTWDKYKPAFIPVQQAYDPDALIQRRPVNDWPQLKAMARTYLAITASSASSERVFSRAKHFLSPKHNRLGSEKLRARVLVDSWSRFFGENEKISDGSRTMRFNSDFYETDSDCNSLIRGQSGFPKIRSVLKWIGFEMMPI